MKMRVKMIRNLSLFLLFTAAVTCSASNKDRTLRIENDTLISNDLKIPENNTLIISPGCTLTIENYSAIFVQGLIIAEGTEDNRIVFTGKDSSRSSWKGLIIKGKGSNGIFRNCLITGAYKNLIWESKPLFQGCEFYNNHYGIYNSNRSGTYITNSHFHNNTYAIVADRGSPMIYDNLIANNRIGIQTQFESRAIAGRNTFRFNKKDMTTDSSIKKPDDLFSIKRLWDILQQIY